MTTTQHMTRSTRPVNSDGPGSMLHHPIMVASLVLLILNDHFLKARFHNAATGKLSDIVGLALFPVLLAAIVELGCWALRHPIPARSTSLAVAGIVTAAGFAAIQTVPEATDAYRFVAGLPWSGQSSVVADITDLLALPAAGTGWLLASRRPTK